MYRDAVELAVEIDLGSEQFVVDGWRPWKRFAPPGALVEIVAQAASRQQAETARKRRALCSVLLGWILVRIVLVRQVNVSLRVLAPRTTRYWFRTASNQQSSTKNESTWGRGSPDRHTSRRHYLARFAPRQVRTEAIWKPRSIRTAAPHAACPQATPTARSSRDQ